MILTGGPELVKRQRPLIKRALDAMGEEVVMAAPTGRLPAASRGDTGQCEHHPSPLATILLMAFDTERMNHFR